MNVEIPERLKSDDFKFILLKKKEKAPLQLDWQNSNNYHFNDGKITNWLGIGNNYGIVCGNGLIVIDADTPELNNIINDNLPQTFTVKTGSGGFHHYYFCIGFTNKRVLKDGKEHLGEILSSRTFAVGPNSIHPNGEKYEVVSDVDIVELDLKKVNDTFGQYYCAKRLDKEEILKGVEEGNRNESIFRIACSYRERNLSMEEALPIILDINSKNNPPMSEYEVKSALESAYRYKDDKNDNNVGNTANYEEFIIRDKEGKFCGINTELVAQFLMDENEYRTIYWQKGETIYLYRNGIWLPEGRACIETKADEVLTGHAKNTHIQEIIGKIKRKTHISIDKFNKIPEGIVCLNNGLFDLKESKLIEFSSKFYFKTKIPVDYDKNTDCPRIKKFFQEALYEDDLPTIQEWFGFNLYNKYFEKKAIILYGDPNTSKTVTLNLLSKFIGEENISNLSLHKIANGKSFDLLNLKDKYSNIYDDLSSKDISCIGGFKMVTGGGSVAGEIKFGDSIEFKPFAKITFATNTIPPPKDVDDDAYFSRWMPIAYDNIIKESEQDKRLLEKLTTKEELSGLFNWSLEGLKRLLENNKFSFNKTPNQVKDEMMRSGHPLNAFAQDCLVKAEGEKISKEEMFSCYTKWCEEKNRSRMTKDKLGKNLERFVYYIESVRDGTKRSWNNVKFNDTYTTFSNTYRGEIEDMKTKYIIKKKVVEQSQLSTNQKEEEKIDEEII